MHIAHKRAKHTLVMGRPVFGCTPEECSKAGPTNRKRTVEPSRALGPKAPHAFQRKPVGGS
eukprot:4540669-Pyramimonas_sp.AAC.1